MWSLDDSAAVMDAEEALAKMPFDPSADDLYYQCQVIITGDKEKARRALKNRVRAMRENQARAEAEAIEAAAEAKRQQSEAYAKRKRRGNR